MIPSLRVVVVVVVVVVLVVVVNLTWGRQMGMTPSLKSR